MELLNNLALGFGVAFSLQNLAYCFAGVALGTLIGGAILTETIFNLTGMGKTLFDAISGRDYFVVQGFTLVVAVGFVLVNLATDIAYSFLDPKVRVQ